VHVTLRAKPGLPSLRSRRVIGLLQGVLISQARRAYAARFQIVHFSVQDNHVHLIVEAADHEALRAGISGFSIAFARRLNMMMGRKGKVWDDRWHGRALTSPREVRNALVYVFANNAKHGSRHVGDGIIDIFSSAPRFDGWKRPIAFTSDTHDLLDETGKPWPRLRWLEVRPRTWLLARGWRKHGLIDPREVVAHPPKGTKKRR
jgi:REP element-mobilizing transposase RayT